jgi:hypothetical protein
MQTSSSTRVAETAAGRRRILDAFVDAIDNEPEGFAVRALLCKHGVDPTGPTTEAELLRLLAGAMDWGPIRDAEARRAAEAAASGARACRFCGGPVDVEGQGGHNRTFCTGRCRSQFKKRGGPFRLDD